MLGFAFVFQMCERCNRHTESTKRLSIQRFPQVIVIRILYNTFFYVTVVNMWQFLTLWCCLTTTPSDLNRFSTSRWSISKSSVYVSFPLTNLDLGPYGPVDCGNKKQSFITALPWHILFTYWYVAIIIFPCASWLLVLWRKQSFKL